MAEHTLHSFAPSKIRMDRFGIPDVMLSKNFPNIFVKRIVYTEFIDMVQQGRSATSIFRQVLMAVINDVDIWANITAKSIRVKYPTEYGAAKDFITNAYDWPKSKWNETKADAVMSQITAERKPKVRSNEIIAENTNSVNVMSNPKDNDNQKTSKDTDNYDSN
jgi:hypothetical protein